MLVKSVVIVILLHQNLYGMEKHVADFAKSLDVGKKEVFIKVFKDLGDQQDLQRFFRVTYPHIEDKVSFDNYFEEAIHHKKETLEHDKKKYAEILQPDYLKKSEEWLKNMGLCVGIHVIAYTAYANQKCFPSALKDMGDYCFFLTLTSMGGGLFSGYKAIRNILTAVYYSDVAAKELEYLKQVEALYVQAKQGQLPPAPTPLGRFC